MYVLFVRFPLPSSVDSVTSVVYCPFLSTVVLVVFVTFFPFSIYVYVDIDEDPGPPPEKELD